MNIFRS